MMCWKVSNIEVAADAGRSFTSLWRSNSKRSGAGSFSSWELWVFRKDPTAYGSSTFSLERHHGYSKELGASIGTMNVLRGNCATNPQNEARNLTARVRILRNQISPQYDSRHCDSAGRHSNSTSGWLQVI
jgi:hypothetical protein